MCNLSELIEERGFEKGIEKGISIGEIKTLVSLVRKELLKIKDAAATLNITVEEFQKYMEKQ